MIDNDKFTLNVNMNGDQYIKYKQWKKDNSIFAKKFKFTNKQRGTLIIIFSLLGLLILPFIPFLFSEPVSTGGIQPTVSKHASFLLANELSWNVLVKGLFIQWGGWILLFILIAWGIHGVGFHIVK